jgi:isopentenyl-diphosphate Delta-isomerase
MPGEAPKGTDVAGIAGRKRDHLRIHLEKDVAAGGDVWAPYRLRHRAVPGFDRDEVDLSVTFFGKRLGAPLLVSGMTGGCDEAEAVNERLAAVAAERGLAMGVGSQRAALEHKQLRRSYEVVREHDVPFVLANLGAPQLVEWGPKAVEMAQQAVAMVEADALAVHLNFLQESVQPEGETNAGGAVEAIGRIVEALDVPVVVKETGAGIGGPDAVALERVGVKAIDVGGLGGTSFSAVESFRADQVEALVAGRLGRTFWDWGIPTPIAVSQCLQATEGRVPIIASGGISDGLSGAKGLGLGADLFGMAGALLRAADTGRAEAQQVVEAVLLELRTAMFLCGARTVKDLHDPAVWLSRP